MCKLRAALDRPDPTYDGWAASHQPASRAERWKIVGLHLLPSTTWFPSSNRGPGSVTRGSSSSRSGSWRWAASNALFCFYHLWQAPTNWAYLPVFFLIPFAQVMQWRKSLWVTIAAHVLINFELADWVVSTLRGLL